MELPPRARRIQLSDRKLLYIPGTTSACAENTIFPLSTTQSIRNYLRVRGEYPTIDRVYVCLGELPPRARRILYIQPPAASLGGTTSACAENTPAGHRIRTPRRNYLRVRGEYGLSTSKNFWYTELPPRARRILVRPVGGPPWVGTTSACAENTKPLSNLRAKKWNYLRVRGEYNLNGKLKTPD